METISKMKMSSKIKTLKVVPGALAQTSTPHIKFLILSLLL